jgi:PAS domain S-box-containing protein
MTDHDTERRDTECETKPARACLDCGGTGGALFRGIVAGAHDGIVVQGMDARIEWVNPACERLYGWSLDEMRGRKPQEFLLPSEARPSPDGIARFRYDTDSALFRRYRLDRHIRRDGTTFWNQQAFAVVDLGPDRRDRKVVITCRDVTDQVNTELALRQVQVDLRHAAHHDDLTGLANRKRLAEHLDAPQLRGEIARGRLGVLVIERCATSPPCWRGWPGRATLPAAPAATNSCLSAPCQRARRHSMPAPERCCARSNARSPGRTRRSASGPPSGPALRARKGRSPAKT